MKIKRAIIILTIASIILLIPLVAMQFTNEVTWTVYDFIMAAFLLLGAGFLCELVLRKVIALKYRLALCLAILFGLLLIWAELAVGILGTPLGGN